MEKESKINYHAVDTVSQEGNTTIQLLGLIFTQNLHAGKLDSAPSAHLSLLRRLVNKVVFPDRGFLRSDFLSAIFENSMP